MGEKNIGNKKGINTGLTKEIPGLCITRWIYKFEYKGETLTQEECIDRMIEGLKLELTLSEYDKKRDCEKVQKSINDVYKIYALCRYYLWW